MQSMAIGLLCCDVGCDVLVGRSKVRSGKLAVSSAGAEGAV